MRGGKGDDKINVYNEKADGTSIVDANGVYDLDELNNLISSGVQQNGLFDGGDGDDEIWGPWSVSGGLEPFRLYGGNGNDIIKGGHGHFYG